MNFINDDFMLYNTTAKKLYAEVKDLPIIDYHCHLNPQKIAENYKFNNAYELFLSGDHYKWRQMRINGIDEFYITGNADPFEKWMKFAETMPYLIGNPLYHWTHLELKRYFDIDVLLTPDTAKAIWDTVNQALSKEDYRTRKLIQRSGVEIICTTDAPNDDLRYHKMLKKFSTRVLPTFRPDLKSLDGNIPSQIDYFDSCGCRLSDHAVDNLNDETIEKLIYLGELYAKKGWVWQLHIGALRNANTKMFSTLGADTGFDSINDFSIAKKLVKILDTLDQKGKLPKTILYSPNPKDNYVIASVIGNYPGEAPGKIQFGSGWWFNDQRDGMESQMRALANLGMISRFVGMLTDSRSFISYSRHEYFRRILCNLVGTWVEKGEYPNDWHLLTTIVTNICYGNAKRYFSFE